MFYKLKNFYKNLKLNHKFLAISVIMLILLAIFDKFIPANSIHKINYVYFSLFALGFTMIGAVFNFYTSTRKIYITILITIFFAYMFWFYIKSYFKYISYIKQLM